MTKKEPMDTSFLHPSELYEISGPDSEDFLNRLTTVPLHDFNHHKAYKPNEIPNEIQKSLHPNSPESGRLGFFLEPTGKILSGFGILKIHNGSDGFPSYLLEVPLHSHIGNHFHSQSPPSSSPDFSLETHLEFFTFGEKYTVKKGKESKNTNGLINSLFISEQPPLLHPNHSKPLFTFYYPNPKISAGVLSVWSREKNPERFFQTQLFPYSETRRIYHFIPFWPEYRPLDQKIRYNPIDLGLAHTVSTPKGCFPGQEVIEKMLTGGRSQLIPLTFKADFPNSDCIPSPTLYEQNSTGEGTLFLPVGTITSLTEAEASDRKSLEQVAGQVTGQVAGQVTRKMNGLTNRHVNERNSKEVDAAVSKNFWGYSVVRKLSATRPLFMKLAKDLPPRSTGKPPDLNTDSNSEGEIEYVPIQIFQTL